MKFGKKKLISHCGLICGFITCEEFQSYVSPLHQGAENFNRSCNRLNEVLFMN